MKLLKLITILFLVISSSCLPLLIVASSKTWEPSKNDPLWGDLKVNDVLVCTKKRPVFMIRNSYLSSDGEFPYGLPGSERQEKPYKYLQKGDKLLVQRMVVEMRFNLSYNVLYVMDSENQSIRIVFLSGAPHDPRFTVANLKKDGFRILRGSDTQ